MSRTFEEILRSIVTDVMELRDGKSDWFGPLNGEVQHDGYYVEWPNLNILIKEAEQAIKEYNDKENSGLCCLRRRRSDVP